ncbi:major capsid protein [Conchiformibius steedae DSM 2580]|uniref:Major capsid protein n=1 Tax=Conchiformibius steedae DSM 2580 TaxID=1121352 RepID=A0AAE9L025_9NEIS|nr:major capsid protein [Conchiformibius steedae]QMT33762.1 phage coat protein [Conchiformibius steedae]URD68423.1 major capsid protein [Conchiformibius steedae DSM 2580]
MKIMNIAKKYAPRMNQAKLAVGGGLIMLAAAAQAEVPQEVTQALGTAKTDALQVGGMVLGIIVAIFALMMMRRVLR